MKLANILIVEDNPMIMKALRYTFSKTEYVARYAVDGLQAKQLYDQIQPSIVISDLIMPFITGLELVEHIRSTEHYYTKIMVLSSIGTHASIHEAFELGADDYMVKPFISSELVSRVQRLDRYPIYQHSKI